VPRANTRDRDAGVGGKDFGVHMNGLSSDDEDDCGET
jgi:hypothetical protein